jgi:hypothetical protein
MKKKLEADLISIAHRVLQMKNKSDINQLCIETRKLYEKLSILRFVEEHFGDVKPTIGQAEIVEKMKQFFEENHLSESKPIKIQDEIVADTVIEEIIAEEIIIIDEVEEEEIIEKSPVEKLNDFGFLPVFELDKEEQVEASKKAETVQISFEDLLGGNYNETLFVKMEQSEEMPTPIDFELPKETVFQKKETEILTEIQLKPKDIEPKAVSLNEKFSKGISIDLNDRIAFVKHLFGNSDEDYNRVLNQLITYDSFEEAQNFIEDMVKPDYNSWEGKENYSQRFIEIIEKKFT